MRSKAVQGTIAGLVLVMGAIGCGEEAAQNDQAGVGAGPGGSAPAAPGAATPSGGGATGGAATPQASTPVQPTPGATAPSNPVSGAGEPVASEEPATPSGTPSPTPVAPGESPAPDTGEPAPVGQEPVTPEPGATPDPVTPGEMVPEGMDPVPTTDCGITVDGSDVSTVIPTVGIITWSATGAIDSASIHFGLSGGELDMEAPVDLDEPGYLTHLIGMKGSSEYDFQIVASSGGQTCSSEVQTIETGPVANAVPRIERDIRDAAAISPGFIVTMEYSGNGTAFIIDKDGDPVWWAPTPNSASGVRMSFDSKYVWMVTGNPFPGTGTGEVTRVSIDGTDIQSVSGMAESHHDLAPLPDGNVAVLIHGSACSEVVEVGPDLSVTPTIDLAGKYTSPDCHANSILYHAADDTFTISDRSANLYVKVDRVGGNLHWQFGGTNPSGDHIPGSWTTNHGHHVLDNGNFLFFNNDGNGGGGRASVAREYAIDQQSLTATEVFSYTSADGNYTTSLGDVQRLPNGNTLITYSNEGVIHEVNPNSEVVQVISIPGALGYAMHRESLYGAPPK